MRWELSDPIFGNYELDHLRYDQAYLNFTSHAEKHLFLYSLSEDCIRCPYVKLREIAANRHLLLKIDTTHHQKWQIFDHNVGDFVLNNETPFYSIQPDIGQFGIYDLTCDDNVCSFKEILPAVNIYLSLLFFLLIAIGTTIFVYLSNYYYTKYYKSGQNNNRSESTTNVLSSTPSSSPTYTKDEQSDAGTVSTTTASSTSINISNRNVVLPITTKPKQRLRSLDTFRGIAIVLMIFVNSGGGRYWWIEHATWNGLHVADLVFPWFLWIMGVCIPMSIKSQLTRNISKRQIILNIFIRSLKLFFIGLILNTPHGPNISEIRIMGVLQRFGIAYFLVASMYTLLSKPLQCRLPAFLRDIEHLSIQWSIMVVIIIIHSSVIFAASFPDCPSGYLGPGGIHEMMHYKNCTGGISGYIDYRVLTEKHLYQWGTAKSTYHSTIRFDPEGIFGCLTTLLQVFFGVQCGVIIMVYKRWIERIIRWLLWAIVSGLLGGALCLFSQDGGIIPINKNLWSLSFVLTTSGLAFLLLTICYLLIDQQNWWSGSPFVYAGMNAIIMYIGHEILHQILPFHWRIGLMNTHFVWLLENAWNSMLWTFVAYYLHCKKMYFNL